ncbi:MAG: hypothetical protein MZV64_32235 [Ignavibacteriales bacterium]|nr:hypothetical protein [Ignavibacteriales bacterium]
MDQTKGRYRWNFIGSYLFSADSTDEIIILMLVPNGSYVIADAIRLISA